MVIAKDRRCYWPSAALLAIVCCVVGTHARTPSRSENRNPAWQPQVWYRLDNSGPETTCQLPAAGHNRFLLVIGCLADASQSHEVRLQLRASEGHQPSDSAAFLSRGNVDSTTPVSSAIPLRVNAVRHQPAAVPSIEKPRTHPEINTPRSTPLDRDFFLHVTDGDLDDPKQYARISARCIGQGDRVHVWLDRQLGSPATFSVQVEELIRVLEDEVLPRVESDHGHLRDVDGDGRFAVVLSPWLSRLQGGRVSIGGMVRSSDFQLDIAAPLGNRCDMLLLNSQLPSGSALLDLLSHEVTHAACISQRLLTSRRSFVDEQDWLSEALAHLSEPGWSNLDFRISTFLDDPSRYPLVVPDYYRAGLWRNSGCRGATFLFHRWCVEQHGSELRGRLAKSSEQGTRNLEQATSRRFEDLFREWSIALTDDDTRRDSPIDLYSRVGRQGLAGIRRNRWTAGRSCETGSRERTLAIRGTAFAAVELTADDAGFRTLCLSGDSAAHWQFSICRLPEDWPNIEMRIDTESGSADSTQHNSLTSRQSLIVRIDEQAGRAIELIQLVCDRRDGDDLESSS